MIREHDAVGAHLHAALGVLDAEDALQHELALPAAAHALDVGPAQLRIDLRAHEPHALQGRARTLRQELGEVRKFRGAFRQHHLPQPARMQQDVEHARRAQLERPRIIALVPFARTQCRHVHRHDELVAARLLRALDQAVGRLLVLERIQLEPRRPLQLRVEREHVVVADGAQREGDPCRVGRLGQREVALRPHHAVETRRRNDQWQVQRVAEHLARRGPAGPCRRACAAAT